MYRVPLQNEVFRIKLITGELIPTDAKYAMIKNVKSLDGGTSIVYDAVIGILNEDGAIDGSLYVIKELYPIQSNIIRSGMSLKGITEEEKNSFLDQVVLANKIKNSGEKVSDYIDDFFAFEANDTVYIASRNNGKATLKEIMQTSLFSECDSSDDRRRVVFNTINKIIRVISSINAKGYIHADIKPGNFIESDALTKAIDFGSCLYIGQNHAVRKRINAYQLTRSKGYHPQVWTEIFDDIESSKLTEKELNESIYGIGYYLDAYAVGMIFKELIFGQVLFRNRNEMYIDNEYYKKFGFNSSETKFLKYVLDVIEDDKFNGTTGINVWQLWSLILLFQKICDLSEDEITKERLFGIEASLGEIILPPVDDDGCDSWDDNDCIGDIINLYKAAVVRARSEDFYIAEEKRGFDSIFCRMHRPIDGYANGAPFTLSISGVVEGDDKESKWQGEIVENILTCQDNNIYVQGLGGSGKSVILAQLYYKYLNLDSYIPLYIDCGTIKTHIETNEKYIAETLERTLNIEQVIDTIRGVEEKAIFVFLIDNMQKLDSSIIDTIYQELKDILSLKNVRVISMGRGPYVLNVYEDTIQCRKIEIIGINRGELENTSGIVLPSNEIFNYPLFACIFLEMAMSDGADLNEYKDSSIEAEILYDYLIEFNGKALLNMSDFEDNSESRVADRIVQELLPRMAYMMLVERKFINKKCMEDILKDIRLDNKAEIVDKLMRSMSIIKYGERLDLRRMYGFTSFSHDVYQEFFCAYYICRLLQDVMAGMKIQDKLYYLSIFLWDNVHVRELVKEILTADSSRNILEMTGEEVEISKIVDKATEYITRERSSINKEIIDGLSINLLELVGFEVRSISEVDARITNTDMVVAPKNDAIETLLFPEEYKRVVYQLLSDEQIEDSENGFLLMKKALLHYINQELDKVFEYLQMAVLFEDNSKRKTFKSEEIISFGDKDKVLVIEALSMLGDEYYLVREMNSDLTLRDECKIMVLDQEKGTLQKVSDLSRLSKLVPLFDNKLDSGDDQEDIGILDNREVLSFFFKSQYARIRQFIKQKNAESEEPEKKGEYKSYDVITFADDSKVVVLFTFIFEGKEYLYVNDILPDETDITDNYHLMVNRGNGIITEVKDLNKLLRLWPKVEEAMLLQDL